MRKIRVAIWGFGAMGQGIAEMIMRKEGLEIVGVVDINPKLVGERLNTVLQTTSLNEVIITNDIDSVLNGNKPDICIIATDSFTASTYEKIIKVVSAKVNVISTAEEMAYPYAKEPELSKQMHERAKEYGVTILGTGINPGLMMDSLALLLSAAMSDVESIECKRVNSLSPFGKLVMEEQGVGLSVKEFDLHKEELAGHVGFIESVNLISSGLGLKVNQFTQEMDKIVTNVDRKSPFGFAKAGDVCGVNMTAKATCNNGLEINMIHPQQIEPEDEGVMTGDYITLSGTPHIKMSISPEVDGGIGTIAMCVNMICHVLNARPGLKTMIDLPLPRAILGDFRNFLEDELC